MCGGEKVKEENVTFISFRCELNHFSEILFDPTSHEEEASLSTSTFAFGSVPPMQCLFMQCDGIFTEESLVSTMRSSQDGAAVVITFLKKSMENRDKLVKL